MFILHYYEQDNQENPFFFFFFVLCVCSINSYPLFVSGSFLSKQLQRT